MITRKVYIKVPVSQSLPITLAIYVTIFESRVSKPRTVQSWINSKHAVVGLFSLLRVFFGVYIVGVTSCIVNCIVHRLIMHIPPRKASTSEMFNSITQLWGTMKYSWGQCQCRGVKCESPRRRWNYFHSLLNHNVFHILQCGKLHTWSKTISL